MAKLVEGNRVVAFAPGTPITSAGFLNEIQDQLLGSLKTIRENMMGLFVPSGGASPWDGTYSATSNWAHHWSTNAAPNLDRMFAPLTLRVGHKITNIDVIYQGSNRTGGEMVLYRRQHIAVGNQALPLNAPVNLFDLGDNAANPWQPAVNPTNVHRIRTAINHVIVDDWDYYVAIASSTTGGGGQEKLYGLFIEYQFGN